MTEEKVPNHTLGGNPELYYRRTYRAEKQIPVLPEEEQMDGHDGTTRGHIRAKAFSYPTQFPQEAIETGSALESALVRLP